MTKLIWFSVLITSHVASAMPLSSEKTIRLEFQAAVHQLVLKLNAEPLAEMPDRVLQQLNSSPDDIGFDSAAWLELNEPRMHEALALFALVSQVADADLATRLTNQYLKRVNVHSSIEEMNKAVHFGYGGAWTYQPRFAVVSTCRVEVSARAASGSVRTESVENLFYSMIWRDGLKKYSLKPTIPGTQMVSQAFIFDASRGTRKFQDDPWHSQLYDEDTHYFADGHGVRPTPMKKSLLEVLDADSGRISYFDANGKLKDVLTYGTTDTTEVRSTTTAYDNQNSITPAGYEIERTIWECTDRPAVLVTDDPHKFPLSVFRQLVNSFNKVFDRTEDLRLAWLQCLATQTSTDCTGQEAKYKASDEARDREWDKMGSLTSLPFGFLLSHDAVSNLALQANTKVVAPTPPPPAGTDAPAKEDGDAVEPAFRLPDRECYYHRRHGRDVAFCDGNLSCTFSSDKTQLVCNDGKTCRKVSGNILCK